MGALVLRYHEAVSELEKGRLSPVYLLYGTETYLMRELVKRIVQQALSPEEQEMNLMKLDLLERSLTELLDEADILPFFAERKIVVGENAFFFTAANVKEKVTHHTERLLTYLTQPSPQTVLIFCVQQEKLDERKKLVKEMKKNGTVVSLAPLTGQALNQWVAARVKEKGLQMSFNMIDLFLRRTGNPLNLIEQELEKLSLYAGNEPVTKEMLEMLVSRSLEENVFLLVDSVVKGDKQRALRIYYDLLAHREEPLKILALLSRQLRILLQVQYLHRQGQSAKQIATTLGLHPYPVQLAIKQEKHRAEPVLEGFLHQLAQLDDQIKSGRAEKSVALEQFIVTYDL